MFQAMHDEMDRAAQAVARQPGSAVLRQYLIDESESFTVSATLGGLLSRRRDRFRAPDVKVRVGDYKFDNTNFRGRRFDFGSRYDLERFPLEDSYPLLRRYLWLETDSAYKSAVEAISRKRAALRNMHAERAVQRFRARRAGASPCARSSSSTSMKMRGPNRVRTLSAIFAQYPEVKNSARGVGSRARAASPGEFRRHRSARAGERGVLRVRAPSRRRRTA